MFVERDHIETLDGFKRLRAARALGWPTVAIALADVTDGVAAKVQLLALHQRSGLTELEEAWLVHSLYRDDGLSQPGIARHLDRHKSWVCRRLLLVEALAPTVQADIRIGHRLLAPRAGSALAALLRGNQAQAAAVVIRRGLTVRQTERMVAEAREQPDDATRAAWLAQRLDPKQALKRIRRAPRRGEARLMIQAAARQRDLLSLSQDRRWKLQNAWSSRFHGPCDERHVWKIGKCAARSTRRVSGEVHPAAARTLT